MNCLLLVWAMNLYKNNYQKMVAQGLVTCYFVGLAFLSYLSFIISKQRHQKEEIKKKLNKYNFQMLFEILVSLLLLLEFPLCQDPFILKKLKNINWSSTLDIPQHSRKNMSFVFVFIVSKSTQLVFRSHSVLIYSIKVNIPNNFIRVSYNKSKVAGVQKKYSVLIITSIC